MSKLDSVVFGKKKFSDLLAAYPWLTNIKLKYLVTLLFFIIWMLFFDSNSYLDHRELNKEIEKLENNKAYYQEEIKNDTKKIKSYQKIDKIEEYAREKYYMKKKNEEIFIIEFEDEEN